MINNTLGELIKQHREQIYMKKSELARCVNVTSQYILKIEQGYIPSAEILESIREVLQINQDIFYRTAKILPPKIYSEILNLYLRGELNLKKDDKL